MLAKTNKDMDSLLRNDMALMFFKFDQQTKRTFAIIKFFFKLTILRFPPLFFFHSSKKDNKYVLYEAKLLNRKDTFFCILGHTWTLEWSMKRKKQIGSPYQ